MKKILIIFLLIAITTLTIATSIMFATSETTLTAHLANFRVFVNGEERNFDNPVVVINDRTYVPLREVGEALDMNVEWCADNRKISISSPEEVEENVSEVFERPEASEGILSTGIRYVFNETEFSVNDFIEQSVGASRRIDAIIIASTPAEVAELGQDYLNPCIHERAPYIDKDFVIHVYYCAETDSWVLQLFLSGFEGSPIFGIPRIIVINRLDGCMTRMF
jgi:hypothetical protein